LFLRGPTLEQNAIDPANQDHQAASRADEAAQRTHGLGLGPSSVSREQAAMPPRSVRHDV
jgi:hypothetical protein